MHTKKQIGRVIGIILSLFLLFSLEGRAQGLRFTVEGGEQGKDYDYDSDVLTVKTTTPITISCQTGHTSHRIVVKDKVNANITLNNVDINISSPASPFDIQGSASVNLTLRGHNVLHTLLNSAAIHCGSGASLTIKGDGFLTATGGDNSAGIGGGNGEAGGTITITSGIVEATGGHQGAGIGGGNQGAGGTIKISGGIVTATGNNGGAGIGKGDEGSDNGSFTTTENGNAFIQATSISDKNNLGQWSGVIFEGNTGIVYGESLTLPKGEITIPSGNTLTIDIGKTLTIEKETTLTNDGVIEVAGTLTNNGTYQGSGELNRLEGGIIKCNDEEGVIITLDANAGGDQVTNLPPTQIIEKNTEPTATPTRTNYTLVGWSTTANGSPITNWSDVTNTDVELYALWKYNTQITANDTEVIYGSNTGVKVTAIGSSNSDLLANTTVEYYTDEYQTKTTPDNSGATTEGCSPTYAGTYYVKATYDGDDNNMKAEKTAIYTIKQAELIVTPTAGQMIYSDEYPAYTYTGQVGNEKPAFTGDLGVRSQLIEKGNLALVDDIASGFKAGNYKLMLSSADVAITVDSQSSTDAIQAALEAINSSVGTGWHKGPVTLTPTPGFKIKGSSILKSNTEDWKDALTVDGNDGTYEVTYQLKRFRNIAELDAQATPSEKKNLIVQLDKTAPTVAVSTSDLTATVSLSDATSGLASCTYNWNNGGDQSVTLTQGENTKSFTLTGAEGIYPLKVTLTDQAGNEATYVGQVTLKENRPTPPPTPTPIYYTVSLPAVEGAITDPAAGDHPVESWGSFSFTIALDADYSESVPLVTVDGTVLTPRESDGKYIIKWVRHDMAVEISGIVKNIPTGTDDIQASAVDIRQSAGVLCIDTPQPLEGKIYSAAGTELRTLRLSAGTNRVYGLPQGVCIIRLSDETTRKVIIATH